jgi:hypothetical protein
MRVTRYLGAWGVAVVICLLGAAPRIWDGGDDSSARRTAGGSSRGWSLYWNFKGFIVWGISNTRWRSLICEPCRWSRSLIAIWKRRSG